MNSKVVRQQKPATRRVLIVVPDPSTLALGRKLWAKAGVEVAACDNTAQAITMLKRQRFDLIAPEVFMENGDVFAFIREVRALPGYYHTPIWVVARSPGPRGVQIANFIAKSVLLVGADYFSVVYPEDIPRLVAECRAVLHW